MNTETIEASETVECMACVETVDVESANFYTTCDGWVCDNCMERNA